MTFRLGSVGFCFGGGEERGRGRGRGFLEFTKGRRRVGEGKSRVVGVGFLTRWRKEVEGVAPGKIKSTNTGPTRLSFSFQKICARQGPRYTPRQKTTLVISESDASRPTPLPRSSTHPPPTSSPPSAPRRRVPRPQLCGRYPSRHLQDVSQSSSKHPTRVRQRSHTGRSLEMTRRIIALRNEDVIIHSAFQRLVQRYRGPHEFLFDPPEAVQAGLQLEVVVT